MLGITKTMHHAGSQLTRGDMSLQYIPIPRTYTRNICVCRCCDFVPVTRSPSTRPCYMCRLSVYYTHVFSLQIVAATWALVSGHVKGRLVKRQLKMLARYDPEKAVPNRLKDSLAHCEWNWKTRAKVVMKAKIKTHHLKSMTALADFMST